MLHGGHPITRGKRYILVGECWRSCACADLFCLVLFNVSNDIALTHFINTHTCMHTYMHMTAFVILEQYQSFAMRFANLVWNY